MCVLCDYAYVGGCCVSACVLCECTCVCVLCECAYVGGCCVSVHMWVGVV